MPWHTGALSYQTSTCYGLRGVSAGFGRQACVMCLEGASSTSNSVSFWSAHFGRSRFRAGTSRRQLNGLDRDWWASGEHISERVEPRRDLSISVLAGVVCGMAAGRARSVRGVRCLIMVGSIGLLWTALVAPLRHALPASGPFTVVVAGRLALLPITAAVDPTTGQAAADLLDWRFVPSSTALTATSSTASRHPQHERSRGCRSAADQCRTPALGSSRSRCRRRSSRTSERPRRRGRHPPDGC